jgi:hypothetical protein
MDAPERFMKFSAECELMAKITHSAENKLTWHRMAERWIRWLNCPSGKAH